MYVCIYVCVVSMYVRGVCVVYVCMCGICMYARGVCMYVYEVCVVYACVVLCVCSYALFPFLLRHS